MAATLAVEAQNAKGLHYKNPRLPLTVKLPDNLECGTKINVHGAVALQPARFSINLKDGGGDANICFHFNPRFDDEPVVVRNSCYNGSWGSEERDGDNPFVPGEEFLVTLEAKSDGFAVELDGKPFTMFQQREGMSVCNVSHLNIEGDMICYGIHIPLSSLPIPLKLGIPGNTCVGDMFFVDGEVPGGSDRFSVNLQCGEEDTADVMFHLNPRFGDGALVCNSKCSDTWDNEIREGLPIAVGDAFRLCVAASKDAYHTFLNRNTLVKFNHRLNMSSACTLRIKGDVKVSNVFINCPPGNLPPKAGDHSAGFKETADSIFYPDNPATLALPSPLEPGKQVILTGTVSGDATRFHLNLQRGSGDDDDIALHVNPRWDSDGGPQLVFNSRQNGEWQEEVVEANGISPGSNIEMQIACKADGYCICVNGTVVLANFGYRMPCGVVNHVVVDGSFAVERLTTSA